MKKTTVIFTILLFLSACKDCEDTSEPQSLIFFQGSTYERAVGISAVGISAGKNVTFIDADEYPLSIVSDTTTYIFYNGELTDTLSIKYNRDFIFESEKCGFTVTLNSFQLLESSSFDSVQFEIYESTNEFILGRIKRNGYHIYVYN